MPFRRGGTALFFHNLNTLIGDYGLLHNFLPSHRITHIFLRRTLHVMSQELSMDTRFPFDSLRHVQVLRYGCLSHPPLSAIAGYLPNLKTLRVTYTHVGVCPSPSTIIRIYTSSQPRLLEDVPKIQRLETLILSAFDIDSSLPSEILKEVVEGLISQMNFLRCVEVERQYRGPRAPDVECQRWTRDTLEPVIVSRPAISW